MTQKSRQPPRQKKDENGKPLCKNCDGPLPPRRPSFCSNDCFTQHSLIYHSGYIRQEVYKRDRGKCKICGVNCTKAYKAYTAARIEARSYLQKLAGHHKWKRLFDFQRLNGRHMDHVERRHLDEQTEREIKMELERLVPNPGWTPGRSTGWDADHIIPVVEGGLKLGLDNLRTVCHPCHKKETAALAARLSKAKAMPRHEGQLVLGLGHEQTTGQAITPIADPKPAEPSHALA